MNTGPTSYSERWHLKAWTFSISENSKRFQGSSPAGPTSSRQPFFLKACRPREISCATLYGNEHRQRDYVQFHKLLHTHERKSLAVDIGKRVKVHRMVLVVQKGCSLIGEDGSTPNAFDSRSGSTRRVRERLRRAFAYRRREMSVHIRGFMVEPGEIRREQASHVLVVKPRLSSKMVLHREEIADDQIQNPDFLLAQGTMVDGRGPGASGLDG